MTTKAIAPRTTVETNDALTDRSMALASAFIQAEVADESILDGLPNDLSLSLIPEDDLELAEHQLDEGLAAVRRGRNVCFLHVRYAVDGALIVNRHAPNGQPSPSPPVADYIG